jgi:hypothetical protein
VVSFSALDDTANLFTVGQVQAQIQDPTNGSEDGSLNFTASIAGTLTNVMFVGNGVLMNGATGGFQGNGTLNATALYENGTLLTAKYGQLAVANTWTAVQTITVTGSFATALQLESTNADNVAGPIINLYRNSASPAAADVGGMLQFRGMNSSAANTIMGQHYAYWRDTTAGAEIASIAYNVRISGVTTAAMEVSNGVSIGSPTGFFQGTGTLNAVRERYCTYCEVRSTRCRQHLDGIAVHLRQRLVLHSAYGPVNERGRKRRPVHHSPSCWWLASRKRSHGDTVVPGAG